MGDTMVYDQNTPGGYTLQMHSTDATTISKIFSQQWDIVVIQEQSQLPAFPAAQVDTTTFRCAHILDSMVHANDTCTQTMFLMTWGYANGDASNCASYPPICTYAGMQQSLRDSYLQMTHDNSAVVAPVGAAWKVIRDSFPAINLYSPDLMHPGLPGSYLEANVLYASIFHKNPFPSSYTAGVTSADAQTLRRIAAKVTLDSLSQWQQYGHYPYANFTYSNVGYTVTFHNQSQKANSYYWTFGDGNTSTLDSPVHNYSSASVFYTASLTVSNACFSETEVYTVSLPEGVNKIQNAASTVQILNGANGKISFLIVHANAAARLEVYDMNGRKIRNYSFAGKARIDDRFVPGIYLYSVYDKQEGATYNNKFRVY